MFDLKYRPKKIGDILGNAGVVKLLRSRSINGSLPGRSMMFGGPKGCGKTTLARIVAKAISCTNKDHGEPCCKCDVCLSIEDGVSPSVDEFDAATQGTVERIRSIINDANYDTFDGSPRVVILDEAHRLSKQSQDALLKPMEERKFIVILCTTEPHAIRTAIRDRVEEYSVSTPSKRDLVTRMTYVCDQEHVSYDISALELIADYNKLNPRTSLTTLETISGLGEISDVGVREVLRFDNYEKLSESLGLLDVNPSAAFSILDHLFIQEGPSWVRDNIVLAVSGSMKAAVGARNTFPVPTDFYKNRGSTWVKVARDLSLLDKVNSSSIESILLDSMKFIETRVQPVFEVSATSSTGDVAKTGTQKQSVPSVPPLVDTTPVDTKTGFSQVLSSLSKKDKSDEIKNPTGSSSPPLEIDGVKFTSDERLTTLDDKIRSRVESSSLNEKPVSQVGLDKKSVPIPPQEFSRVFTGIFK
jgi:DNA polymerase III subunit gamma/tau